MKELLLLLTFHTDLEKDEAVNEALFFFYINNILKKHVHQYASLTCKSEHPLRNTNDEE